MPNRMLFDDAVRSVECLLSEFFWVDLSDLLFSSLGQSERFCYGPNRSIVPLCSEFFLGYYANEAVLLRIFPREEDGWSRMPVVELNERPVTARFAISALFGISGEPQISDPHRMLTYLVGEIESRVELLSAVAWREGDHALTSKINAFEKEYFEYFRLLMAKYNDKELLYPKRYWAWQWMKLCVSWWG